MWQRIQTVHFSIAMLLNLAIFWIALAEVSLDGVLYQFNMYHLSHAETGEVLESTLLLAILCAATVLLSIACIAWYKKRQAQIKVAQLNLLVQAAFLAAVFFIIDGTVEGLSSFTNRIVDYQLGAYLAVLPLIFIFLGIKAIKKDEALVRAADRIR